MFALSLSRPKSSLPLSALASRDASARVAQLPCDDFAHLVKHGQRCYLQCETCFLQRIHFPYECAMEGLVMVDLLSYVKRKTRRKTRLSGRNAAEWVEIGEDT